MASVEINEYDDNENLIYQKWSNGLEQWFDANGNEIHWRDSRGDEAWFEYDKMEIELIPNILMDMNYGRNLMTMGIESIGEVLVGMDVDMTPISLRMR